MKNNRELRKKRKGIKSRLEEFENKEIGLDERSEFYKPSAASIENVRVFKESYEKQRNLQRRNIILFLLIVLFLIAVILYIGMEINKLS
ncbi:MAG: hypothetical protein JXR34_13665 [Bacteroidales bacterium]|nr:hypothetical protein [Bacteroidales bacterium]